MASVEYFMNASHVQADVEASASSYSKLLTFLTSEDASVSPLTRLVVSGIAAAAVFFLFIVYGLMGRSSEKELDGPWGKIEAILQSHDHHS